MAAYNNLLAWRKASNGMYLIRISGYQMNDFNALSDWIPSGIQEHEHISCVKNIYHISVFYNLINHS